MHVCLLPTEILLAIIEKYGPFSPATLAALARTSTTFKEPALDMLWKDIRGFKPLISCLPEGAINRNERGMLTIKRPLLTGEWRLIGRYAQRIQSLMVFDTDLEIIDDRLVQALISAPPPLLPNLRSLVWGDVNECLIPLLRTLLGSTIKSMKLDFRTSPPSFAKSALVASLGARCPSIWKLICYFGGADSEDSSDAIFEVLCGFQELLHLEIDVPNTRALLHLAASLSPLKYLHLNLREYNMDEMQPNSTPAFSSHFDHMHISIPAPSFFHHILRNVRFLSCRSVIVCVDFSGLYIPYNPLDIPDLIFSFSECFSPALEKIRFDFDYEFCTIVEEHILADTSFAFDFDVVAPLLSFSHLTDLDLNWICTSAIDDASLKTMAQSFPQLENFLFGSSARWVIPPSLTFIGLVHLIHHCRRLRSIAMTFCACPVDINSEPFSQTIPNNKITRLFVGVSPIVDPNAVACQLQLLLPKLTLVGFLDWLDVHFPAEFPAPPPFERFEDEWIKVNKFLGSAYYQRNNERENGPDTTGTHAAGLTDPIHIA
ncbi:uncharacterized protein EDB91DRAFT_1348494 [Suillus paluster]|uniref:uncharacterized protein n=1 Tax=Suillus paluster TaxID=48578 RepID=UPI001B860F28|nr:uncharacterized protein EDB91DRAFT_1348494 [Suillus paluster]KAG1734673.1 hypothetical protein EDB91DRAFT_1348494 [Suillus paluster]